MVDDDYLSTEEKEEDDDAFANQLLDAFDTTIIHFAHSEVQHFLSQILSPEIVSKGSLAFLKDKMTWSNVVSRLEETSKSIRQE